MAKRSAPPSAAEPNTKKPKSGSKPASTSKAATTTKAKAKATATAKAAAQDVAESSPLKTVKQAATDLINTVSEAVDVAGDLLIDDGNTPAPVSQVVQDNIDLPALKKKGKAVKDKAAEAAASAQDKVVENAKPLKGKAAKAAKDAQDAIESTIEDTTGVDVKAAKGKAGKAAQAAKEKLDAAVAAAEPEVEKAVEAAKPLKGKAAKAAKAAQDQLAETTEQVTAAAKDPKNRKRAEDFLTQAEETVLKVVGDVASKIGEVATGVVNQFGEASGLAGDIEEQTKKGKKVVQKKANEVVEEGKKQAGKKGKQAKEAVEEVKEQATKKGKQAQKAVDEKATPVIEEGKKQVTKKGKQAQEAVEDVKAKAGKKGKQAQEVVEEVQDQAGKKGKQAQKAAEEVTETGKRKANAAVDAVEPTMKKAKAAAEPVVEKGKKAAGSAAKAAQGAAGKATKAVVDTAEQVVGDDEDQEDGTYLGGFSSSDGEADSSDDESDAEDLAVAEAGRKIDLTKLPSVAKDDKSVQARLKKASKKKDEPKGTLFVGRIPHGFYEEQMKEYFSQFGDVSRVRLARNRKTGASKHYAYVEIVSQSVAEIVAETMNNYLLMGHLLKVNVIPHEQVHPQLWVGANKKFRKVPRARLEQQKHDKPRTDAQKSRANDKLIRKQDQRKQKIKDAGINYDFEGHAA